MTTTIETRSGPITYDKLTYDATTHSFHMLGSTLVWEKDGTHQVHHEQVKFGDKVVVPVEIYTKVFQPFIATAVQGVDAEKIVVLSDDRRRREVTYHPTSCSFHFENTSRTCDELGIPLPSINHDTGKWGGVGDCVYLPRNVYDAKMTWVRHAVLVYGKHIRRIDWEGIITYSKSTKALYMNEDEIPCEHLCLKTTEPEEEGKYFIHIPYGKALLFIGDHKWYDLRQVLTTVQRCIRNGYTFDSHAAIVMLSNKCFSESTNRVHLEAFQAFMKSKKVITTALVEEFGQKRGIKLNYSKRKKRRRFK